MDQLQQQQLATQAAIAQRNVAFNQIIELQVRLSAVTAELTELKAQQVEKPVAKETVKRK